MNTSHCFHCGLPNPHNPLILTVEGEDKPFCCVGCQSAANTIISSGLGDYYKYHQPDQTPLSISLSEKQQQTFNLLDRPDVQSQFVRQQDDTLDQAIFLIEGISCSACAWLIDKRLMQLEGVITAQVNSATHRLSISWQRDKLTLSTIAKTLFLIGYRISPFVPSEEDQVIQRTQRQYILRLGVAGIGMMQAMMNAVALYSGQIIERHELWLWWTSLFLTIPVILISARPFFTSAWRALAAKQMSMDVSVSVAILSAFIASVWATITASGEVYYESVNMFTFFLVLSRFLEFRARTHATHQHKNTLILPTLCRKITDDETIQCTVNDLQTGDIVEILAGEVCPIDGVLVSGNSQFDESSFTGEFSGIQKTHGAKVLAGSVNLESAVRVQVVALGANSSFNLLRQLIEQAGNDKPRLAELADKGSQQFVWTTLVVSLLIGIFWYFYQPERAFWVVISVLVVTCPCALSLATPTALSQALSKLKKQGLILTRGYALERLAQIDTIAFDKTGTLTEGKFSVVSFKFMPASLALNWTKKDLLALCHQLEKHSEHPIAQAFPAIPSYRSPLEISDVKSVIGHGVQGSTAYGTVKLGNAAFTDQPVIESLDTQLYLTLNGDCIAQIGLNDKIRSNIDQLFSELASLHVNTAIITGDPNANAKHAFTERGLTGEYFYNVRPEEKLSIVKQQLPQAAFVGDGINDGPVLAGAHLSIAVNNATDLSKTQADALLLNDNLMTLVQGIHTARKTNRIIKQNLAWALVYNLIALPVAAMGLISPWQAAIGMSVSSLLVVGNAIRLRK
jgi:Cu2+-exporting ATPase